MAKIDLSFLWEPFAIASGVPPSTWQTVSGDRLAVVQSDENDSVSKRPKGPPLRGHLSGRKS